MVAARRLAVLLGVAFASVLAFRPATARADEECPLGSVQKTDNGQTWCEPSVCTIDDQCPTGSVCRPVPLCVEVGVLDQSLATKDDAGERLMVRQRCGADKSCPQRTTCSEKSRCITRTQADRARLLTPSGAPAASGAAAPASEAPKKACGCHVPGAAGGAGSGALLALLGLVAIGARRRTRVTSSRG